MHIRTNKAPRMAELRSMLAEIKSAQSAEILGNLYVTHIGYNPFEDCPSNTVESVRNDLTDFIREVAASEDIHWLAIVGEPAIAQMRYRRTQCGQLLGDACADAAQFWGLDYWQLMDAYTGNKG